MTRAIEEQWFERARKNGRERVSVSYDPRNISRIYLHEKKHDNSRLDSSLFEECTLLDHQERYFDKRIEEILDLLEIEKQSKQEYATRQLQSDVELAALVKSEIDDAKRKSKVSALSDRQRVKDIKENRRREREIVRGKEAFKLLGARQTHNANYEAISSRETRERSSVVENRKRENLEFLRNFDHKED